MAFVALGVDDLSRLDLNVHTRCVYEDGRWRIANAALYTMEGEPVREFPPPARPIREEDLEPWEASARQSFSAVTWLDDDHFVINTSARVFLYTVSTDELELADDLTEAVSRGYSIYSSSSYGAMSQDWVRDGVYYYLASRTVYDDQLPRWGMYALEPGKAPRQVVPERENVPYEFRGDGVVVMDLVYAGPDETGVDRDLNRCTVEFARLPELQFEPLAEYLTENFFYVWDGRFFCYDTVDYSGGRERRINHCLDTETGEEHLLYPQELYDAERYPYIWHWGLRAVRETEAGLLYLYVTEEPDRPVPLPGGEYDTTLHYYIHNSATGETGELDARDIWEVSMGSFHPRMTHFADGYDTFVKVMPFELPPDDR